MKQSAIALAAALVLAGCGGSGGKDHGTAAATATAGGSATTGAATDANGKLPPGPTSSAATNTAAGPTDTAEEAAEGPAASEASPEAPAVGPRSTGELPDTDSAAVATAVRGYVTALDRHDAARVCTLIAPGGLDLGELPKRRGGCRSSLRASIGSRPRAGGPAWRHTDVVEVKPEALGDDRARVTTTVTHHFADRTYVSVEDDVIYLERAGDRWVLAKPSATLYRAVGYAQPPLRAFSPPASW
jgi:hypothetical protein